MEREWTSEEGRGCCGGGGVDELSFTVKGWEAVDGLTVTVVAVLFMAADDWR